MFLDIKDYSVSLSVVIPTLGRSSLVNTLSAIEMWSIIPREVFVVLPYEATFSVGLLKTSLNVIEVRARAGQVSQRLAGFQCVSSELVLQLDDDVTMTSESLLSLVKAIQECDSCAVAPGFYKYPSGDSWETLGRDVVSRSKTWILKRILGAPPGLRSMGSISRAGVPFGVDPSFIENKHLQVDWAPGGALLHRKGNLIIDPYFPFEGRAAYEDLFHSVLLRKNGIRLLIIRESRAYHPVAGVGRESWDSLIHSLKINFKFVEKFGFSKIRFLVWAGIRLASYSIKKALDLKF